MYRYIAFIWNNTDPGISGRAQVLAKSIRQTPIDWALAFKAPGIQIFHSDVFSGRSEALLLGEAHDKNQAHGVALGTLFYQSAALFSGDPALQAMEIRDLITKTWGRYVAFQYDPVKQQHLVLRDPTGQLSCYHTCLKDIHLYVSDIRDLAQLTTFHARVNNRFLLANLAFPELTVRETALSDVHEVLPGECHVISPQGIERQLCWLPTNIAKSEEIADFNTAAGLLRQSVQDCVAAWASRYTHIIHSLSGGFDSSITLACLHDTETASPLCLNYRTEASDGDESAFARIAARHFGAELVEIKMPGTPDLASLLLNAVLTASPGGDIFGSSTRQRERDIAVAHKTEVFLSGEGGDHLFYQMTTDLVAADYARARGLTPRLFAQALGTAIWTGQPYTAVLGTILKFGLFHKAWQPSAPNWNRLPFLQADAIRANTLCDMDHPWMQGIADLPPGKAWQIYLLPKVLHRYETSPRSEVADIIHPLLSQPLIELVLKIPSYVLTRGGESRALAKAAFVHDLPKEILGRKTKGGTTSHFARMAHDNLAFIRSFLLDGLLVQQDFIDVTGLENYLSQTNLQASETIPNIFRLLATEAWLRAWENR